MKKYFFILLFLWFICLSAVSCTNYTASENDTLKNDNINTETQNIENPMIDVDLTVLSSTMVYAEVYNIMIDPDSYVGKIIKGNGIYDSFYYEEIDRYFHYFIISDATGCCPQGIDFIWNGEHIYPDDYPEIGENIEVTGVFVKGELEGFQYYYLAVDDITVLK